jgi:hypothetical protein
LSVLVFQPSLTVQARSNELIEFEHMNGVHGAFVGSAHPVRGINGGGLPWVIRSAEGEVSAGGDVEVGVRGLVLDPNDPTVISRGLAGVNPIAFFKAVVSCISTDPNGNPVVINVSTAAFPAITGPAAAGGGDARFETHVTLPAVCKMPVVFITSPGGSWFAATRF